MKATDIKTLPIEDSMTAAQQRIRRSAPRLLTSVINDSHTLQAVKSIDEMRPEHLKPLGGGADGATYLVNLPGERVIIKMGGEGVAAEAEAINAWHARHVRVPRILKVGTVPVTRATKRPIRYLVQEALTDSDGRILETCADYLTHEPSKARQVGEAIGRQLDKIHSCVAKRTFGEFRDASGSTSSYQNWNGYIVDATLKQAGYLEKLDVSREQLDAVVKKLRRHHFIRRGRYLHGDFSIRNVAVKRYQPLKVSVFDPNPLVGDPSWDVSFIANNYEFEKCRLEYDDSQRDLYVRNQQLWIGFKKGYRRQIDDFALLSARLVQAVYQAQYTESINDEAGFRARKAVIREIAAAMLA